MMTLAAAGHGIGNFKFFHPPTLPPVYCGKFELSIGESVQVKPSKPNKNQNLNKTKQTKPHKTIIILRHHDMRGITDGILRISLPPE